MRTGFLITTIIVALSMSTAEAAMKKNVSFISEGQTLAGHLYLPDSFKEGDKLPGVVVTGAWTSVKEQMAGTYAAAMADQGYAALAFDFRGWGGSPDATPYLEDPARKTEDIHAAVAFLAARDEVDGARVAGLGICASAGYMSDAAQQNDALKSVALVAPWLHDAEIVAAVYGGKEGVAQLMEVGREAESAAEPMIIEAASTSNPDSLMYQAPYYTEPDRGLIPQYDNKFNLASWPGWLSYDAIQTAARQSKPMLMVHSEAAAIPQGAKKYAEQMGDQARIVWLDQVTQFDFYDQPEAVKASVDAVSNHFARSLK